MTLFKRFTALMVVLILVVPCFCFNASAAGEGWIFIEGENINREVDSAVIYFGVESTNQSKWGYNLVLDSEYKVISVIESGKSEGENIEIPENGAVISASGNKRDWFEENIAVGDSLYYDSHTQRLFILDINGEFNPYINKEFTVTNYNHGLVLKEGYESESHRIDYTYAVVVDGEGYVVARGGDVEIPEGGKAIYATTEADRNQLIANAPIGAHCSFTEGFVTFVYDETMLAKSIEIAISAASARLEKLKAEFKHTDIVALQAMITDAQALLTDQLNYKTVCEVLSRFETEFAHTSAETLKQELRSAFHTPYNEDLSLKEKSEYDVRQTVLSAKSAGLNSIILRIPNGYGTYIPLPEGDRFAASSTYNGFDLLQTYINVCKKENIHLTLCIDVYYNPYAAVAAKDWCSLTNVEGNGLQSKYFSPAKPEFKEYFLSYVEYIIGKYDIEALMFDHLRFPKFTETTDLGYDYPTIELFNYETDIPIPEIDDIKTLLTDSPHWSAWVNYRKGLVDTMARSLSDLVRSKRSDITVTVIAERDTVPHFYMQSTMEWINDKIFDGVCVAVYENDPDECDPLGDNAYYGGIIKDKCVNYPTVTGDHTFFFVGLESSAQIGAEMLSGAIEECRSLGADGYIFSSLTDFLNQHYDASLSDGVLRDTVLTPFDDSQEAIKKILEFSKIKIHDSVANAGGCENETYASAAELIDKAIESVQKGEFSLDSAKELKENMAILFAESPAKASVLQEYNAIIKTLALTKNKEITPEEPNAPSEPDNPQSPENSTGDTSNPDASEDASGNTSGDTSAPLPENNQQNENRKINISLADIIIYGLVLAAAVGFIAAVAVSISRKRSKPKTRHMPKGSQKGYGEEKDK